MNALVTYNQQLPDFLRNDAFFKTNADAAQGIGGGRPAHISIKQAKWRLVDEGGGEAVVNQLHLDVVIVHANPAVSKLYYENKYDPSAEATPPTCFSDNGIAPSVNATSPQSQRCGSCQWAAWGSDTSAISGKAIKACADSKKIAVVLAVPVQTVKDNILGQAEAGAKAYQMSVPATSMKNLADLTKKCTANGFPIRGLVVRLQFDPNESFPLITFTPTGVITQEFYQSKLAAVFGDEAKLDELVGLTDVPIGEGQSVGHPTGTLSGSGLGAQTGALTTAPAVTQNLTGAAGGLAAAPAAQPAVQGKRRPGRPSKAEMEARTAAAASAAGLVPGTVPGAVPIPVPVPVPTPPPAPPVAPAAAVPSTTPTGGTAGFAFSHPVGTAAPSQPQTVVPPAAIQNTTEDINALLDAAFKKS